MTNEPPMHPITIATIDQLKSHTWFAAVGQQDSPEVSILDSWNAAAEHCRGGLWEDIKLRLANSYVDKLFDKSDDAATRWNSAVVEVKRVTHPLVEARIAAMGLEPRLVKAITPSVQWDILHVCMEAEFSEAQKPSFYAALGYWYTVGHFPCGWNGEFPNGNLIVY